jgi:hypothetical protein
MRVMQRVGERGDPSEAHRVLGERRLRRCTSGARNNSSVVLSSVAHRAEAVGRKKEKIRLLFIRDTSVPGKGIRGEENKDMAQVLTPGRDDGAVSSLHEIAPARL